jgi:hypothetical protein
MGDDTINLFVHRFEGNKGSLMQGGGSTYPQAKVLK